MLDKKTMRNAISVFRRFQIVETLDKDLGREDSRVIIFDSTLISEENGAGRLTGYGSVISECKCKTVYQYGTGKVHICSHYSELKKYSTSITKECMKY